jgi:predicted homoserine dehydrogenase-like protein
MAVGQTLTRPVKASAFITADCVARPDASVLWRLRAEQDATWEAEKSKVGL